MKLRIRGNSIRLRLLRSEAAKLAEDGEVSEKAGFGNSTEFIYTLAVSDEAKEISARFEENEIKILLPKSVAMNWVKSEQVSLTAGQKIDGSDDTLKILVEKDFVCLERKDDPDNADAFNR
jgi:hypothetical protein